MAAAPSLVLIFVVGFGVALLGPPGSFEPFLILPLCLVPLVVGHGLRSRAVRNEGAGAGDVRSRVQDWNSRHPVLAAGIVLSPIAGVLVVGAFRHVADVGGWLMLMSVPAVVQYADPRRRTAPAEEVFEDPRRPVDRTLAGRARRMWRHPETAALRLMLGVVSFMAASGAVMSVFSVMLVAMVVSAALRARAAAGRPEATYRGRRAGWEAQHPNLAKALLLAPAASMWGYLAVSSELNSFSLLLLAGSVVIAVAVWSAGRTAPPPDAEQRPGSPVEQG